MKSPSLAPLTSAMLNARSMLQTVSIDIHLQGHFDA